MNKVPERFLDSYSIVFGESQQREFLSEVAAVEKDSCWYKGIQTRELTVEAIEQIEILIHSQNYHIPYDVLYDTTCAEGSHLLLHYAGRTGCLRAGALVSLEERAKITGAALTRMSNFVYAEVLNHCYHVAKGDTMLLERCGKITALQSDNDGGYCVMPIPKLLEITQDRLSQFGTPVFKYGLNQHDITYGIWELPDAQSALMDAYQQLLDKAVTNYHAINFMPAVQFGSSDTRKNAATLMPVFRLPSGSTIRFGSGIQVNHERNKHGIEGIDLFAEKSKELFAKFYESAEILKEMAETEIENPESFVIGICMKNGIPQKYGERAREQISMFTNGLPCSLHDIYLSLCEVIGYAKSAGASPQQIFVLEEKVAKLLTQREIWDNYDLPGLTWDTRKEVKLA